MMLEVPLDAPHPNAPRLCLPHLGPILTIRRRKTGITSGPKLVPQEESRERNRATCQNCPDPFCTGGVSSGEWSGWRIVDGVVEGQPAPPPNAPSVPMPYPRWGEGKPSRGEGGRRSRGQGLGIGREVFDKGWAVRDVPGQCFGWSGIDQTLPPSFTM
jgi:hypothetical protein